MLSYNIYPKVAAETVFFVPHEVLASGLDKDLDRWVFHPLLFNLMSIFSIFKISSCRKWKAL